MILSLLQTFTLNLPPKHRASSWMSLTMTESSKNSTTVSALRFECLSKYLPREVRDKIYTAYFEPPLNHYLHPQAGDLRKTVADVQDTNPDLFEEILFTVKRISSKPQHVLLNSKLSYTAEFEGFPKSVVAKKDWLSIQYLVLKVVYFDCSVRERFSSDITRSVCISLPREMGMAWNRIKDIQKDNPHLGELTKVRFDMVYDDSHAERDDPLNTDEGAVDPFNLAWSSTQETSLVMPLSDLIKAFPLATNVWAEPCGSIDNPRALQTIRAFNLGRRVFERCNPSDRTLNMATVMAAKGKADREFEIAGEGKEDKMVAKKAANFLRIIKKEDWAVKNKIKFEILCNGCQVKFKGDREVAFYPEERCLTRRLHKEHRERSLRNHGANGPCA